MFFGATQARRPRLSPQAQLAWHRACDVSGAIYTDVEDWTEKDDEILATRVVADEFLGGRIPHRHLGAPSLLPNPGRATVMLGTMLEMHVWDRRKQTIVVHKYSRSSAPPLLWSPQLRACYAIPGKKLPVPTVRATSFPNAYRLFRLWNDGKYPRGASKYRIPRVALAAPQTAIAICYWSDKFHEDGDHRAYIHHFEKGVMCRTTPGRVPRVYFVRGGRLVLTRYGLDH